VAHFAEFARHLADVDELAAEVRVGRQVAVVGIEVPLGVYEGEVYCLPFLALYLIGFFLRVLCFIIVNGAVG
jgi:hypothetical protein